MFQFFMKEEIEFRNLRIICSAWRRCFPSSLSSYSSFVRKLDVLKKKIFLWKLARMHKHRETGSLEYPSAKKMRNYKILCRMFLNSLCLHIKSESTSHFFCATLILCNSKIKPCMTHCTLISHMDPYVFKFFQLQTMFNTYLFKLKSFFTRFIVNLFSIYRYMDPLFI